MHGVAAPAVDEFAREPTSGGESIGVLVGSPVDNANYLGVSRECLRFSGGRRHLRRCQFIDVGVILSSFGGTCGRPQLIGSVVAERGG